MTAPGASLNLTGSAADVCFPPIADLGSTTLLRAARFAGQDVQEPNRDASVRYVYLLGSS